MFWRSDGWFVMSSLRRLAQPTKNGPAELRASLGCHVRKRFVLPGAEGNPEN